jgi:hypothetical protein
MDFPNTPICALDAFEDELVVFAASIAADLDGTSADNADISNY